MKDEILFTPPLLANLLMAGLVIPSVTGFTDLFVCLFPPTFPYIMPLLPFPTDPVIIFIFTSFYCVLFNFYNN